MNKGESPLQIKRKTKKSEGLDERKRKWTRTLVLYKKSKLNKTIYFIQTQKRPTIHGSF